MLSEDHVLPAVPRSESAAPGISEASQGVSRPSGSLVVAFLRQSVSSLLRAPRSPQNSKPSDDVTAVARPGVVLVRRRTGVGGSASPAVAVANRPGR